MAKKPEKEIKADRLKWSECIPSLAAAEARFSPVTICRATVPCDAPAGFYVGQNCGFPVESGDKFNFLLESGEWAE